MIWQNLQETPVWRLGACCHWRNGRPPTYNPGPPEGGPHRPCHGHWTVTSPINRNCNNWTVTSPKIEIITTNKNIIKHSLSYSIKEIMMIAKHFNF